MKKARPEDDIRENIISYNDEDGGKDDMTGFNRSTLKVPLESYSKETIKSKFILNNYYVTIYIDKFNDPVYMKQYFIYFNGITRK
ncbi:hypothetical protein J6590_097278 [Homalodisca vitripennis]|nr:hypothetical protein J6590_097278 [Homalodisca vitripennis]